MEIDPSDMDGLVRAIQAHQPNEITNILRRYQGLTDSQLALLGAELFQRKAASQPQIAAYFGISRSSLVSASTILREGDAATINEVRTGKRGLRVLATKLRKTAKVPGSHARIERQRMDAEVWQHLRAALDHLTSLPLPAEVAAAARNNRGMGRYLDPRLDQAHRWLDDFYRAWSRPNGTTTD